MADLPQGFREKVEAFEGLVLHTYLDVAGYKTIGFGHLEDQTAPTRFITREEADALLTTDLEIASNHALLLSPSLTGWRLAAITDFIFNFGAEAYQGSMLRRHVDAGRWASAAASIKKWNHAHVGGKLVVVQALTKRRNAEAEWLLGGTDG